MIGSRRKENNVAATPIHVANRVGKSLPNVAVASTERKLALSKTQPIAIAPPATNTLGKMDVTATALKKRQALAPKTPALSGIKEKNSSMSVNGGNLSFQPKKLFVSSNAVPSTPLRTAPGNLKKVLKTPALKNDAGAKKLVYKDSETPSVHLEEQIVFPPPVFAQNSTKLQENQKSSALWAENDEVEYAPPKIEAHQQELDFDAFDMEAVKEAAARLTFRPMLSDEQEAQVLEQWKKEDLEWRADLFEPEAIPASPFPSSLSNRSLVEFAPSLSPISIPPTPPVEQRRMGTTPKRPLAPYLPSKEFSPRGQSALRLDLYDRAGGIFTSPVSRAFNLDNNHDFDINWTAF